MPKYLRWTKTAVECYQRGCDCSDCYIRTMISTKCRMKESVFELVRTFGKPDIETIQFIEDENNEEE